MTDDIKSCPFCGSEPKIIEKGNEFTKKRFVEIKCSKCPVNMIQGAIYKDMEWLRNIMIGYWNKRTDNTNQG